MDDQQGNDQVLSSKVNGHRAHDAGPAQELKRAQILEVCRTRDIAALADLAATEGGLLHDELRRKACKLPTQ